MTEKHTEDWPISEKTGQPMTAEEFNQMGDRVYAGQGPERLEMWLDQYGDVLKDCAGSPGMIQAASLKPGVARCCPGLPIQRAPADIRDNPIRNLMVRLYSWTP